MGLMGALQGKGGEEGRQKALDLIAWVAAVEKLQNPELDESEAEHLLTNRGVDPMQLTVEQLLKALDALTLGISIAEDLKSEVGLDSSFLEFALMPECMKALIDNDEWELLSWLAAEQEQIFTGAAR